MTPTSSPVTPAPVKAMSEACYRCVHRRPLPGSAHSQCAHPETAEMLAEPLGKVIGITGKMPPCIGFAKFHVVGIRGGWASWPFNFDPVWLVDCSGFEERAS